MNTEFPSIELHFVFALTYCKLRVYKSEEVFARTLLQNLKVEMVGDSDSTVPIVGQEFQPMDTRLLMALMKKALPKMIADAVKKEIA